MTLWSVRFAVFLGCLSGVFLFFYSGRYQADLAVWLPHFFLVGSLFVSTCALRVFLHALGCALNSVVVYWLGFCVVWWVGLLLCLWYGLLYLGLVSWGRIPTWKMLGVYAADWRAMGDVMGVTVAECGMAAVLALVLCVALPLWVLRRLWMRWPLLKQGAGPSRWAFYAVLIAGLLLPAAQYVNYTQHKVHPEEPLAAFFESANKPLSQTHGVLESPVLNARELKARSEYVATHAEPKRNLIVIVADALRADHLGLYGYHRATSTHLQRLVNTQQSYVAPITRAVCAESFCGLMGLAASRPLHLLARQPITLHEALRRNGYEVSLVLSGDHTNFYGLKTAYGEVDVYLDGTGQQRRSINDDYLLLDWAEAQADFDAKKPVAIQFHMMSTHGLGPVAQAHQAFSPATNFYRWRPREGGRMAESEGDTAKAVNHYDNGVVQFDWIVNQLLSVLKRKGYLDNALVVITADHGEMLGEKGRFGHQFSVDEAVLGIPLIMLRSGYSAERWPEHSLVSQVDIAPTVLQELELNVPPTWAGERLQFAHEGRDVFFQQGYMAGLYSSKVPGFVVKYWLNSRTGEDFVEVFSAQTQQLVEVIPPDIAAALTTLKGGWKVAVASSLVPSFW